MALKALNWYKAYCDGGCGRHIEVRAEYDAEQDHLREALDQLGWTVEGPLVAPASPKVFCPPCSRRITSAVQYSRSFTQ